MKKVIVALIVFIVVFLLNDSLLTSAEHSGGGGDFGTPHQESEYQEDTVTEEEAGGMLMQVLQFLFFGGTPITAYIIYERKLSKSARASKKIMKMLDQKDSIWKFKNILAKKLLLVYNKTCFFIYLVKSKKIKEKRYERKSNSNFNCNGLLYGNRYWNWTLFCKACKTKFG